MNQRLLHLVDNVLGKGTKKSKANYAYYCPFCNHRKKKLEVNIDTNKDGENQWHCWVCDSKGKTLISLFRKLKVGQDKFNKLNNLLGNSYIKLNKKSDNSKFSGVNLPEEFKPLWVQTKDPEWKNAIKYVMQDRKVTREDILKYRIGYCGDGTFSKKIIIPSYDENGDLNFFTGRSYYDVDWKHKNYDGSKDVVGFGLFVNWNLPIILCEGAFDAIAIKRNAIPLFGKLVLDQIKMKIVQHKVKTVYIALDSDALKKALEMVEYFMSHGIKVHLVNMDDKDPSEMGFESITKLIKNTPEITFQKLMEYKLFRL